jgi:hypothetical protein
LPGLVDWQAFDGREDNPREALSAILGGRPVLALAFDDMEMVVNAPEVVPLPEHKNAVCQPVLA